MICSGPRLSSAVSSLVPSSEQGLIFHWFLSSKTVAGQRRANYSCPGCWISQEEEGLASTWRGRHTCALVPRPGKHFLLTRCVCCEAKPPRGEHRQSSRAPREGAIASEMARSVTLITTQAVGAARHPVHPGWKSSRTYSRHFSLVLKESTQHFKPLEACFPEDSPPLRSRRS